MSLWYEAGEEGCCHTTQGPARDTCDAPEGVFLVCTQDLNGISSSCGVCHQMMSLLGLVLASKAHCSISIA